jgi:hypothetical protein
VEFMQGFMNDLSTDKVDRWFGSKFFYVSKIKFVGA